MLVATAEDRRLSRGGDLKAEGCPELRRPAGVISMGVTDEESTDPIHGEREPMHATEEWLTSTPAPASMRASSDPRPCKSLISICRSCNSKALQASETVKPPVVKTYPLFNKRDGWYSASTMFLRCTNRKKDGKEHRYWSVVENRRVSSGKVVQRQVLYLGEINDSQREAWRRTIEVFEDGSKSAKTMALFPEDRHQEIDNEQVVKIRLKEVELRRPRQWGVCWLACTLYQQLGLDTFWAEKLPSGRKKTRWDLIVQALCCYHLVDPGSEWRLHRHWYETSAMADLLGAGFELVEIHKLYECLDRLIEHKQALFDHLTQRWKDLFNAKFDVLLYDLTSTYFESNPPFPEGDKRRYGYSRDKRFDCVQVVIALIVTPEGFLWPMRSWPATPPTILPSRGS